MLLNRVEGRIFAIKDRCLHRGVTLSDRIECYSKQTISCWYHGWTYRWDSGKLVDILTNPKSVQIGRHALKTYHVEEVQGVVFVYVGRSEEHTSELQSLMRISYAVSCLKTNTRHVR